MIIEVFFLHEQNHQILTRFRQLQLCLRCGSGLDLENKAMKIKVEEAEKRADLTTCLDITKRKHLFIEYLSITEMSSISLYMDV